MAFSGIPLPKVVADVGPGGPIVTGMQGANALTQGNLQNKFLQAELPYAPYNAYANALSKIAYANLLPYQIQAQVMSNPLMWMAFKDNPEAMKSMIENFKHTIPQGNSIFGNVNIPNPSSQQNGGSGGLFSMLGGLLNKFLGNNDSSSLGNNQNNMNLSHPSGNNAMSSTGDFGANNKATPEEIKDVVDKAMGQTSTLAPGGIEGYAGSKLKPMNQQIVDPGKTANINGQVISAPSARQVTNLQSNVSAAQRLAPQLQQLADKWKPFMTLKGHANLLGQKIGNYLQDTPILNQLVKNGEGDLPSKYSDAKLSSFYYT